MPRARAAGTMSGGPMARRLGRIAMASVSEAECRADPEGAFHTMQAVMRAALRARQSREDPTE
jgi:hypothetical protein